MPIIWVVGGPGVGKSTQSEKIVTKFGFTYLSNENLLRAELSSGSERALELSEIMERGETLADDVYVALLKEAMSTQNSKGFLIDGYPTEKWQGITLEKATAPVTMILSFEAEPEILTARLLSRAASSGLTDENKDTVKQKVDTYFATYEEILLHYASKTKRINAERPENEIFTEVVAFIKPLIALQTIDVGPLQCS